LSPSLGGDNGLDCAASLGIIGADHAQIVKVVDDYRSLFPD